MTQSSRTSSIAKGSNLYQDSVEISLGTSGASGTIQGAQTPFQRSRSLGRPTNPNTNRGLVHNILAIEINARYGVGAAAEAQLLFNAQILRGIGNLTAANLLLLEDGSQNQDKVAFQAKIAQSSRVPLSSGFEASQFNDMNRYFVLPSPIIMVTPYIADANLVFLQSVNQAITSRLNINVFYTIERIEGEQYRRLLDAFGS